jgi:hypothetical protein
MPDTGYPMSDMPQGQWRKARGYRPGEVVGRYPCCRFWFYVSGVKSEPEPKACHVKPNTWIFLQ